MNTETKVVLLSGVSSAMVFFVALDMISSSWPGAQNRRGRVILAAVVAGGLNALLTKVTLGQTNPQLQGLRLY